jgi:hypothetical protein
VISTTPYLILISRLIIYFMCVTYDSYAVAIENRRKMVIKHWIFNTSGSSLHSGENLIGFWKCLKYLLSRRGRFDPPYMPSFLSKRTCPALRREVTPVEYWPGSHFCMLKMWPPCQYFTKKSEILFRRIFRLGVIFLRVGCRIMTRGHFFLRRNLTPSPWSVDFIALVHFSPYTL